MLDLLADTYNKAGENILGKQILSEPKPCIEHCSILPLLWKYEHNWPDHFQYLVQVTPLKFRAILALIQTNPIFYNNSNNPQAPIQDQLAVYLYCLGHYRNTTSVELVTDWAGMSVGSVESYTNCMMSAILTLHDYAMQQPTDAEVQKQRSGVIRKVAMWHGREVTCQPTEQVQNFIRSLSSMVKGGFQKTKSTLWQYRCMPSQWSRKI